MIVIWLVCASSAALAPGSEVPAALEAFLQARAAIVRADVYMSRSYPLQDPEPFYFRNLIAGSQRAVVRFGTLSGVTGLTPDGIAIKGRPKAHLWGGQRVWNHDLNTVEADAYENLDPFPVATFQSLGIVPSISALNEPPAEALTTALRRVFGDATIAWSETHTGNVYRVQAAEADEQRKLIWWISPAMGWNATRVEWWQDGQMVYSCDIEYEEHEGLFVPVSVAYFNAEGELWALDQVHEIEVNRPDLPSELMPEHIGIEVGMTVYLHDPQGGVQRMKYAGDGRVVSADEFDKLLRDKRLTLGPKVLVDRAGGRIPLTIPDPKAIYRRILEGRKRARQQQESDPWAVYTQRFIERYQLDSLQRQKAMQILRSCQAERDHYLRGKGARIEALRRQIAATTDSTEKERLARALHQLESPIQRIFETKLKPRLHRLPTRSQRRRVEKAVQTREAGAHARP